VALPQVVDYLLLLTVQPAQEGDVDFVGVGDSGAVFGGPLIQQEAADELAEALPDRAVAADDSDLAVLGRVEAPGGAGPVAAAGVDFVAVLPGRADELHDGHGRLLDRQVDEVAGAAAQPAEAGRERGRRRSLACDVLGNRDADPHRLAVRLAREVQESHERLGHNLGAHVIGVRAVEAERDDADHGSATGE
jgi:hypothetical protein